MSHLHADNACWVPIFVAWADGATDTLDFGDCPVPQRLQQLLSESNPVFVDPEEDYHYVEIRDEGWFMQHPLACRPNLMECQFNVPVGQAPKPENGRYRVTITMLEGESPEDPAALLRAVKFWPRPDAVTL